MTEIDNLVVRKIINSRGEPTVEVEVKANNRVGVFSSPSGASVGKYEAVSYPRGDVDVTIKNLRKYRDKLIGLDVFDQTKVDEKLREVDGTDDFSRLGGNGAIAVSMATAKAAAKNKEKPLYSYLAELIDMEPTLPLPLGNIIEGGEHAGEGATEIQEFLALPTKTESCKEAVLANARVHKKVKKLLKDKRKDFSGGKGDEGGWVESLKTKEALDLLKKAIDNVEDEFEVEIDVGLDVAASEIWDGEKYRYRRSQDKSTKEQIEFMKKLSSMYDIKYIEDPLREDDFNGFHEINNELGEKSLICGDDLFVTNKKRIKKGIKNKSANTVLIKPNQIGTLTDTLEAIKLSKENNYKTVVSHRSGETTDKSIAHLAVSTSEIIKCGAVNGERIAKLNELIRIEEKSNIETLNLRC